jgi:hypothetical protein
MQNEKIRSDLIRKVIEMSESTEPVWRGFSTVWNQLTPKERTIVLNELKRKTKKQVRKEWNMIKRAFKND